MIIGETSRIRLRCFTTADLEHLIALYADPEVMRYVDDGGATREDLRDDYLPNYLKYYKCGDAYGFWVGEDRVTGDFLGWWHLRPQPGSPDDEPELGYRLTRAAWGRGLATEGSQALVSRGFREHGVRRVVAAAAEANVASWKVMEKLGMRRMAIDDGVVHYALEHSDWVFPGPLSRCAPRSCNGPLSWAGNLAHGLAVPARLVGRRNRTWLNSGSCRISTVGRGGSGHRRPVAQPRRGKLRGGVQHPQANPHRDFTWVLGRLARGGEVH